MRNRWMRMADGAARREEGMMGLPMKKEKKECG